MKSETEIREMLGKATKERDSYLSGDGEHVWQDGFMSALMMVLENTNQMEASQSEGR